MSEYMLLRGRVGSLGTATEGLSRFRCPYSSSLGIGRFRRLLSGPLWSKGGLPCESSSSGRRLKGLDNALCLIGCGDSLCGSCSGRLKGLSVSVCLGWSCRGRSGNMSSSCRGTRLKGLSVCLGWSCRRLKGLSFSVGSSCRGRSGTRLKGLSVCLGWSCRGRSGKSSCRGRSGKSSCRGRSGKSSCRGRVGLLFLMSSRRLHRSRLLRLSPLIGSIRGIPISSHLLCTSSMGSLVHSVIVFGRGMVGLAPVSI
ncbi:hypothetical protein ORF063R [Spotted knifejaw iridovirus]|nr:hypothetical protein ORF063R [Spotted knifejaw iridovirus]